MRNNFLETIAPERTLPPPEVVARIKAHFNAARSNRKTLSRTAFKTLPYTEQNLQIARAYLQFPEFKNRALNWARNNSEDVEIIDRDGEILIDVRF